MKVQPECLYSWRTLLSHYYLWTLYFITCNFSGKQEQQDHSRLFKEDRWTELQKDTQDKEEQKRNMFAMQLAREVEIRVCPHMCTSHMVMFCELLVEY